ncbi:MAG TPA: hypothetical protein PLK65_00690 [Candidatus Cloacimonas sp.]|nr:hypothetical protein [Candidatus Cloacimonas sp.]
MRNSRHESSLPNELVHSVKVISAVTTPDLHLCLENFNLEDNF